MKWLKKVKNWLQGEEIIEIEEVIIDDSMEHEELNKLVVSKKTENSDHKTPKTHLRSAQLSDPETKVLYQYPKGQFKFPLIPDEKSLPKRKASERVREEKRPRAQERHKNSSSVKKQKVVASEHERKISPSKKPFRPTEIPSPIYGFQRQRQQKQTSEKTVEFELETTPVLSHESEHEIDVPVFIQKNKQQEEQLIHEPVQQQASVEEIIPFTAASVEEKSDIVQAVPVDEEKVDIVQAVSVVEEKVDSVQAVSADEEKLDIVQAVSVDKEKLDLVQAGTVDEEKLDLVQAVAVDEEKLDSVLPFTASSTSEMTNIEQDNRAEEFIIEKEEPPRKKHIPFNVVMLKKDHKPKNLPSFKEREKKTKLFQKVSSSEIVANVPTVEKKQVLNEEEGILNASIPLGIVEKSVVEETSVEEKIEGKESTQSAMPSSQAGEETPYYMFPNIELLTPPTTTENDEEWLAEQTALLDETLINFNVRAHVVNVTQGPAVTRFEVFPEPGVKVNKVTNLMDDIKLSLAAQDLRMEAPIPGKHTIGIEIPNRKSKPVFLREVLESEAFQNHPSPLAVAMGLDISGQPIVTDLRKMPHGLIAGQTGSGKSVCINTMLVSLLYKATPQELKLMLIDPKMVELAPYNRIPHLVSPVITDVKAATAALKWAVDEMERRYELFVHAGVRDITKFNEHAEQAGQYANKLPYILIIIDELADLMMMSPADVEEAICRIAQKARACGIHLIVATQRPSVDVITGLIKANIPTRIAFSVSSQVDSRTIIDSGGAEKLLGRGDMLFAENGSSKTVRLQGTFVSDDEIDQVVQHVKKEQQPNYLFEQEELLNRAQVSEDTDELFFEACEFVVSQHTASTSSIQRRFRVGYNRAARLMEMMEQQGIISESKGSKPRDVLIAENELEYLNETNAHTS